MDPIVKHHINGKRKWTKEELAEDRTILPALRRAEALGLIILKVGLPSKALEGFGVPIMAVVVGLTAAGQAMADAA